jgi:hypothetical protein
MISHYAAPHLWIPRKIRRSLYRLWHRQKYPWEKDSVLLASIRKSGTNYFRLIFANYINLVNGGDRSRVSYAQMQERYPWVRTEYLNGLSTYDVSRQPLAPNGYRDFLYQHDHQMIGYFEGPTFFLVRNPLDQIVSLYYFASARKSCTRAPISEYVERLSHKFAKTYCCYRRHANSNHRAKLMHYENLFLAPFASSMDAFLHVFPSVNVEFVQLACQFANIRETRREEDVSGPVHGSADFVGRLAREGTVGQWHRDLTDQDVAKCWSILRTYDVSSSEFVLDGCAYYRNAD